MMPIEVKTTEGGPGDPFRRKVEIGQCVLYLADCGDMVGALGLDERTAALVTDPNYGIGEAAGKNKSRGKGVNRFALAEAKDYGTLDWDDEPAPKWLLDTWRMRTRWQVIFGGNYFKLPPTTCWLIWDKLNGTNDFADAEMAWTNLPGAVRTKHYRWNGCIRQNQETRGDHPTQKPIGVMLWCLDALPAGITVVVDPFMGSGTTLVAAIRRGMPAIGIEQHEPYFLATVERLRAEYEELERSPRLPGMAPPPVEQLDMSSAFDDRKVE